MEPNKHELQLVSNMIMCGDHPSITKTELNAKDTKPKEEKEPEDVTKFAPYGRISPTSSNTDKPLSRSRAASTHALRALAARRRARSLDLAEHADGDMQGNRALVQAAIGSFRWPPYLLCVWVLVLVLTHVLHCLVGVLDSAMPAVRKLCHYFRAWTEASWRAAGEGGARGEGSGRGGRACPLALAGATGALYALYGTLLALHAAALWAVEPLCADVDTLSTADAPKVIDYDEINAKLSLNVKQ